MDRTDVVRVVCGGLLGIGVLGCLRVSRTGASVALPVPVSPALESRTITDPAPGRAGQLTRTELDSIAPHVRSLRASPQDLVHTVGDSIRVRELVRVLALDSAGAVLGDLPYFDYGFSGRGARPSTIVRIAVMRDGP